MCYGWYDEVLLAERMRIARQKSDEKRRSTEPRSPTPEAGKERKPEHETEIQPEVIPA